MLHYLIARRWVGSQTLWWPPLKANHLSWLGPELLVYCLADRGSTGVLSFAPGFIKLFGPRDLHRRAAQSICESSFLIHQGGNHYLFVLDGSLTS